MTKAERIFKDTFYSCKNHIKAWGYEGYGFTGMNTNELVYARTANEIKKLIVKKDKEIKMAYKLNVITLEEAKEDLNALEMVKISLENQYIA